MAWNLVVYYDYRHFPFVQIYFGFLFFSSFNFLALFHKERRWRRTTKRTRSVSLFGIASWTSSFSFRSAPEFAQLEMSCTANRKRQKKKWKMRCFKRRLNSWAVDLFAQLSCVVSSVLIPFWDFQKMSTSIFFPWKILRLVSSQECVAFFPYWAHRVHVPRLLTPRQFLCVPSSWFRCCRSVRLVTFEVLTFHFDSRLQSLLHRFQPEKKKIPPASAFKSARAGIDSLILFGVGSSSHFGLFFLRICWTNSRRGGPSINRFFFTRPPRAPPCSGSLGLCK